MPACSQWTATACAPISLAIIALYYAKVAMTPNDKCIPVELMNIFNELLDGKECSTASTKNQKEGCQEDIQEEQGLPIV